MKIERRVRARSGVIHLQDGRGVAGGWTVCGRWDHDMSAAFRRGPGDRDCKRCARAVGGDEETT